MPGGAAGQAHDGVERVDGRQVRLELRREGGEGGRVGGRRRRGEQEAGGGDEVDAAVEQEAALEGRGFAPGRLCCWYLEPSAMRSWILALKLSTRPSVATCAAACWIGDMKRKFSATPQLTALGSTAPLRSYHSSRARAEAMSGAMGFSDSTCLPAASAALI